MINYFPWGISSVCFDVFSFFFLVEMLSLFLVPPVVFLFPASFLGKMISCPGLKATGIWMNIYNKIKYVRREV